MPFWEPHNGGEWQRRALQQGHQGPFPAFRTGMPTSQPPLLPPQPNIRPLPGVLAHSLPWFKAHNLTTLPITSKFVPFEPRGGGQGQEARRELESTHSSMADFYSGFPLCPSQQTPTHNPWDGGTWARCSYLSVSASSWRKMRACVLHQAGALESPRFDLDPLLDSCPATPPSGSPYPHRTPWAGAGTQTGRPGWAA